MVMIGKQAPPAPDTIAHGRRARRAPEVGTAAEALDRDATLQSLAQSLPGASVRP
jgi:hypothetical protein